MLEWNDFMNDLHNLRQKQEQKNLLAHSFDFREQTDE